MNIAIKAGSLEIWSERGDLTPHQDIIIVDKTTSFHDANLPDCEELTPHVFKLRTFLGE